MKIAILMGSDKDATVMQPASDVLQQMGIEHEVHVMSAHRNPDAVSAFARGARENGFAAIICGAGKAAHLAGAVAAQTTIPVIGVPIAAGALRGVDALYATVQMPTGIPVATVAIDSSANAAYLAASIVSLHDDAVASELAAYRQSWTS
jgi:5-(carboxyamino)imidazole ribonucleotide mutase